MEIKQECFTNYEIEHVNIKLEQHIEDNSIGTGTTCIKTEAIDVKSELEDGLPTQHKKRKTTSCDDKSSPKHKRYKCNKCNFVTKYLYNMKKHVLRHFNPNNIIAKSNKYIHVDDSSEQLKYNCTACNYSSTNIAHIRRHSRKHYPSDEKPSETYKCEECDYTTHSRICFKKHSLVHKNPSEIFMYSCPYCDFKTKHKTYLPQHIFLIHKEYYQVKEYKCNECGFKTTQENTYTEHKEMHQLLPNAMYSCNVCEFETKMITDFKRHMHAHTDTSNTEDELLKCPTCNFTTKYEIYLSKHMLLHVNGS